MLRRRSLALVLTALAALAPAAAHADWTVYGRDFSHSGRIDEAIQAPLAVLWKFASRPYFGLPQNAPPTVNQGSPIVVGNTIYFASRDRFYAVDRTSGEMKWRYPGGTAAASTIRSSPTYADGTIYFGANDGNLYALDAETGSQKWIFRTTGSIRSHPIVVKPSPEAPGMVIFGSDDDFLYAIPTSGERVIWKYANSRDDIASAIAYDPDTAHVYFVGSDLMIHAVNITNGKRKWQMRVPIAQLNVSPVLFQGRLYMPAGTGINRYRLTSGTMDNIAFSGPANEIETDISTTLIITEDPLNPANVNAGTLYFGDRNGNFYSTTLQGKRRWKVRLDGRPTAMPVMTGETLCVGTEKGFVYALNAKDGAVLWSYRSEAPRDYQELHSSYHNISAPLVADNGQLLVLGDDGTLTCFTRDAVDANPPVITAPIPARGTVMNGTPPLTVGAYLWDEGSGINPATVAVFLDGVQMQPAEQPYWQRGGAIRAGVTYDPLKRRVDYSMLAGKTGERSDPLKNGPHTVRVQAADWKGNVETLEWSFTVDNTLPIRRPRTTSPTSPRPGTQPGVTGGYPGGQPGIGGGFPGAPGTRPPVRGGRGPVGRR